MATHISWDESKNYRQELERNLSTYIQERANSSDPAKAKFGASKTKFNAANSLLRNYIQTNDKTTGEILTQLIQLNRTVKRSWLGNSKLLDIIQMAIDYCQQELLAELAHRDDVHTTLQQQLARLRDDSALEQEISLLRLEKRIDTDKQQQHAIEHRQRDAENKKIIREQEQRIKSLTRALEQAQNIRLTDSQEHSQEIKILQEQIDRLNQQIASSDAASHLQEISKLKRELELLQAKQDKLKSELSFKEEQLREIHRNYKEKVADANSRVSSVVERSAATTSENERLQIEISDLTFEIEQLKLKLETQTKIHAAQTREQHVSIVKPKKKSSKDAKTVKHLRSKTKLLEGEITSWEERYEKLQTELSSTLDELHTVKTRNIDLYSEQRKIEKDLTALQTEKQQLNESLDQARSEIKDLKSKLTKLRSAMAEQTKTNLRQKQTIGFFKRLFNALSKTDYLGPLIQRFWKENHGLNKEAEQYGMIKVATSEVTRLKI